MNGLNFTVVCTSLEWNPLPNILLTSKTKFSGAEAASIIAFDPTIGAQLFLLKHTTDGVFLLQYCLQDPHAHR